MSDDQEQYPEPSIPETPASLEPMVAVEEEEQNTDPPAKKSSGGLKFLSFIMFALAIALIAMPFVWGLEDKKAVVPDSSVLTPWLTWLGDMHFVVLHIPIGIFVYVFSMEIIGLLSFRKFKPHLGAALAINAISAIVAAVFGYFLFLQGDRAAPLEFDLEGNPMGMHMWLSILFAVFVVFSFISKMWSRHHGKWSPFYPLFMLVAAASMTVGAHFGGEMVHPDKKVLEDGKILFCGGTPGVASEDIVDVEDVTVVPATDRLVYGQIVKPILQGKCWECHADAELNPLGKSKIKGGLVMTSTADLLKGGKNNDEFPSLVVGDAAASEIIARVYLDSDDEDFMPPGKEDEPELHLTKEEIKILEWWINKGIIDGQIIGETNDVALSSVTGYEEIVSEVETFKPVIRKPVEETAKDEEKSEEKKAEPTESKEEAAVKKLSLPPLTPVPSEEPVSNEVAISKEEKTETSEETPAEEVEETPAAAPAVEEKPEAPEEAPAEEVEETPAAASAVEEKPEAAEDAPAEGVEETPEAASAVEEKSEAPEEAPAEGVEETPEAVSAVEEKSEAPEEAPVDEVEETPEAASAVEEKPEATEEAPTEEVEGTPEGASAVEEKPEAPEEAPAEEVEEAPETAASVVEEKSESLEEASAEVVEEALEAVVPIEEAVEETVKEELPSIEAVEAPVEIKKSAPEVSLPAVDAEEVVEVAPVLKKAEIVEIQSPEQILEATPPSEPVKELVNKAVESTESEIVEQVEEEISDFDDAELRAMKALEKLKQAVGEQ